MSKKIAAKTAATVTPIAPKDYVRELTLDGTTYRMDFNFSHLCEAEKAFDREGRSVNLLFAMSVTTLNLVRLRDLFAATVYPSIPYAQAIELVTPDTFLDVANVAFEVLLKKTAA